MTNAIILHGKPSKEEYFDPSLPNESNRNWLPWLQKQLILRNIKADTPEVPSAFDPKWDVWCKEVERYQIGPETILIGHSCGGGFWIKYLSLHPKLRVGKVILVAPWIDPDGDETNGFFDNFTIDNKIAERTKGLVIFHSDNDMGNVHKSVAILKESLENVQYREFHKYGHFCYEDMGTDEFPELAEEAARVVDRK